MEEEKKETLANKILEQFNEDQDNTKTWKNVNKAKEVVQKVQKEKKNE
jgi:hypothetical protein